MSSPDISVPIHERHFEDYLPGSVVDYAATISVRHDDIIKFANQFDPQSFHTDPEAAVRGPYGGLIASGWHTAGIMMRLLCDQYLSKVACLGSPGIDELRFTRPVRPGDSLRIRVSTLEANRSRSKPDRGIVRAFVEVLNQDEEVVLSLKAMVLMRCRQAAPFSRHAAASY
ncbi:MAG: MaoC family dehydratase [Terriglobales bacterium]